ncbi:MAG: gliding motility-associated C-terminal domain-containing protein [Bacteroidia bacterium]
MKNTALLKLIFVLLLAIPAVPEQIMAQWHVDTTIVRALCDERGGKGGSVFLKASGVPGPYTYIWSNGFTGDSVVDVAPALYAVTITGQGGKDTSLYITVRQWGCDPDPALTFTPNGDGIHDTWNIGNAGLYENMLVMVYNRWGQMVWQHTGMYQPWDGKSYLGLPVEGGVYFWVIYENAGDKGQGTVAGSVTIIR